MEEIDVSKLDLIGVCVFLAKKYNNIRFIYENQHGNILLIGENGKRYNSFINLRNFNRRVKNNYYRKLSIFKDTKLARKIYPKAKEFKKGWLYVKTKTFT